MEELIKTTWPLIHRYLCAKTE